MKGLHYIYTSKADFPKVSRKGEQINEIRIWFLVLLSGSVCSNMKLEIAIYMHKENCHKDQIIVNSIPASSAACTFEHGFFFCL